MPPAVGVRVEPPPPPPAPPRAWGAPDPATEPPPGSVRLHRSLWGEAWRWLLTAGVFLAVAAGIVLGMLWLAVRTQAQTDQARPADAIVILGAAQYNCALSPVLEARTQHALDLWNQGLAPVIFLTGGRSRGDQCSEAEAEWQYLVDRGVPSAQIWFEEEGNDTWSSMQGVAKGLLPAGLDEIVIVSDGFHLFRAKMMARDLGFTAWGSPAPGSPITPGGQAEQYYMVREVGGVVAQFLRRFGVDIRGS